MDALTLSMKVYIRRKAVSPVIAVVLIIALTAATVGTIWVLFQNFTSTSALLNEDSSPTFADSPSDPDLLVDTISLMVINTGTGTTELGSARVTQGSSTFTWSIDEPTTEIGIAVPTRVIISSDATTDQLIDGDVTIKLYDKDNKLLFTTTGTVTLAGDVDTIFSAVEAYAYQDEGTLQSANISNLIYALDDTTAPAVPDGTVTRPYFATGSSSAYWDALALNFSVGSFTPTGYTATLRIFIFDGGYSTTWHHYLIQIGKTNSSYQDVSPPAVSTAWDDGADNGPTALQIDITLKSNEWSTGSFWVTLRLWDAKVDQVQLIITPNA